MLQLGRTGKNFSWVGMWALKERKEGGWLLGFLARGTGCVAMLSDEMGKP